MADKVGLSSKGGITLVAFEWFGVQLKVKGEISYKGKKFNDRTIDLHLLKH